MAGGWLLDSGRCCWPLAGNWWRRRPVAQGLWFGSRWPVTGCYRLMPDGGWWVLLAGGQWLVVVGAGGQWLMTEAGGR